jgi:hypothetical protein
MITDLHSTTRTHEAGVVTTTPLLTVILKLGGMLPAPFRQFMLNFEVYLRVFKDNMSATFGFILIPILFTCHISTADIILHRNRTSWYEYAYTGA